MSVSCRALSSPGTAQRVQEPRWVKGYSVPQKTQRSVVAYIALSSPDLLSLINLSSARTSHAGIIIPCQCLGYWLIHTFKADGELGLSLRSSMGNRLTHGIIPLAAFWS